MRLSIIFIISAFGLLGMLRAQPIAGCYLGAYLGGGSVDISSISPGEFNALTGKQHAVFTRYMDSGSSTGLLADKHWIWADTLKKYGAVPAFFLMPYDGLSAYSSGARDADLDKFAERCRDHGADVFILFAHEMNTPWPPWGQKPEAYRAAFAHVSERLKQTAPNVRMCWIPGQAWGYPWGGSGTGQGYDEYYPGDEYVDWVGMTVYDRDWNENNTSEPDLFNSAITYLDFYKRYAKDTNKPMMLAETGLYDANWDPTPSGQRTPLTAEQQAVEKNGWISQIYNVNNMIANFRNLNLIIYFHVLKKEEFSSETHNFGNINVNWRIPTLNGYEEYKNLIKSAYFRSAVITGLEERPADPGEFFLYQNYPNPFNPVTGISWQLAVSSQVDLSIYNIQEQKVATLVSERQPAGMYTAQWDATGFASGVYFYQITTGTFRDVKKMVLLR